MRINIHTHAHQCPHSCPSIPTLVSINTNTRAHQYPHWYPSIPTLVPISTNTDTRTRTYQYQHWYPPIPTLVPVSTHTDVHQYPHSCPCHQYLHSCPPIKQPTRLPPSLPTYPFFYPRTRQIFPFLHQQEDEHEHAIPNCRTSRLTISATRTDRLRDPN